MPALAAAAFTSLDVAEVKVGDAVEDLELVVGEHDAGIAGSARPLDERDQIVGRPIDLKVGAAIDPALAVGRRSRRLGRRGTRRPRGFADGQSHQEVRSAHFQVLQAIIEIFARSISRCVR